MVERCTICASKIIDGSCSNEKCVRHVTKETEKVVKKDRRRSVKRDSK